MRKIKLSIILLMVGLLLFSCVSGKELKGKVVSIQDGDTITILRGTTTYKIRLDGIDCPEKKQAFGNVAKQFTAKMVFETKVQVLYKGKDQYGRFLGTVITSEGKNLNRELLKAGLAWHYKYFNHDEELAALETQARIAHKGLWSDPEAIPPWDFRHRDKENP